MSSDIEHIVFNDVQCKKSESCVCSSARDAVGNKMATDARLHECSAEEIENVDNYVYGGVLQNSNQLLVTSPSSYGSGDKSAWQHR